MKNPWHDNVFDWTDISKSKIEDLSDPLEKQALDNLPVINQVSNSEMKDNSPVISVKYWLGLPYLVEL